MTAVTGFGMSDGVPEISGDKVFEMLKSELGPQIASALVNCRFYKLDPDDPGTIKECDQHSGRLRVLGTNGVMRTFALKEGFVYLEPHIAKLLAENQILEERDMQAEYEYIRSWGFTSEIRDNDFEDMLLAVKSGSSKYAPDYKLRKKFMETMSIYQDKNVFINVAISWIKASRNNILPDVLMKLLPALRETGRSQEAIKMSDFLDEPCHGITMDEKRILLTIRAAALLDSLEFALEKADLCIKASKAIGPSEHLDRVADRLEGLRPRKCICAP